MILLSAFLFTVYSFSCIHEENQQLYNSTERITNTVSTSIKEINVPKEALALINAYPEYVIGYKDNLLFFFDSTSIIFDDAIIKTEQELLNNADINDMFIYTYPKGATLPNFKPKYDPGRIRNELFFKKIYGSSKEEVINNLVEVNWCPKLVGKKIKITSVNNIHLKIKKICQELDEHPEFLPYIESLGGTFNWRKIKDTDRLSMHSFGLAIDLNVSKANYWKWDVKNNNKESILNYRNKFPKEIILIFEKHGFIWGGKWKHYDTMHFEYRPELLI